MKTLDDVVREIFEIIPSYYEKRQAAQIRRLFIDYMNDVAERDEAKIEKLTMDDEPLAPMDKNCATCAAVLSGHVLMDEVYVHPH